MLITDTASTPGRVVRPGDPDWDAARGTFNLLIDQRPEAIAFPADEREVAAVVAGARERGLRVVAARPHGAEGAPASSGELTPTERRVAELAAGGSSNKEIAQALFVSVRTVEAHLTHAYAKLGVRSRTQLARRLG
jgi:DNA-binding NarL/FixJ family response regulator